MLYLILLLLSCPAYGILKPVWNLQFHTLNQKLTDGSEREIWPLNRDSSSIRWQNLNQRGGAEISLYVTASLVDLYSVFNVTTHYGSVTKSFWINFYSLQRDALFRKFLKSLSEHLYHQVQGLIFRFSGWFKVQRVKSAMRDKSDIYWRSLELFLSLPGLQRRRLRNVRKSPFFLWPLPHP